MSTQNRNSQGNSQGNSRGNSRGNNYKRGRYKRRNYNNKFNKYSNIPKLEKCPFVAGSNEYFTWKRERYPTRTLYGCNNKVLMVFTSKFNKD